MAPSNNAVHTEQIVRDITGSVLCSYQIAHYIENGDLSSK